MPARHSALTRALVTPFVALVLTASGLAVPGPAAAESGAGVSTDPTGAHVVLHHDEVWVEVGPVGGGGSSSTPGTGCHRRWVPTAYAVYLRDSTVPGDYHVIPMPPRPTPEYRAYFVYCDARYVTSVWLQPSQFAAGGTAMDPRTIAEQLARDLPYPPAAIGISPAARGLTGLEAWFWVSGYTGEPLRDAVEGFGLRVEVEARPASVQWDFGDGSGPSTGTLGAPAPARSDVTHVYEPRSRAVPFTVRATVRLDVRWRLDGGAWQNLTPVTRAASRPYPVAESRAALVPTGTGPVTPG